MHQNEIIVGIDYGEKYIGFAVAQDCAFSQPYQVIKLDKHEKHANVIFRSIDNIEKEFQGVVKNVALGIPLDLRGEDTKISIKCRDLKDAIEASSDIIVHLIDERFTSRFADSILRETESSRKKRSEKEDAVSASIILNQYIQNINFK